MTNKTPVGTYRGPGRFETDFFRERLFDIVAQDLGIDRVEFRRKNLDRAGGDAVPARDDLALRCTRTSYDSGDYSATLDRCLKEIGWAEKAKLQGKLIDGRYHGLAVGCFIEGGAAGPKETRAARARTTTARSRCIIGSSAVGQGVETVFAQIAADALEMPMDRIRGVYHGSTAYRERRLRRLSLALGGDGRLGAARRRQQFPGGAPRGGRASGFGCDADRRSRSTRTR